MEAKVTWDKDLNFVGVADSGYEIKLASHSNAEDGAGPVEMVAIALAGCTAMDVISILQKKKQHVTGFEVKVHAERTGDHPKVITRAVLEYVLVGKDLEEAALLRAIELSITKYCPVHAMLQNTFPIEPVFSIFEEEAGGSRRLVKQGKYKHVEA